MHKRLASGARLEIYDQIDSTNREARRRAEAGERDPLWIIANRQTDGYGRRGASWIQSEGDLAATILFAPTGDPEKLPQISLVAAVALTDALVAFAPTAPIALKWPNDVLLGGGKIAGLLLELVTPPQGGVAICLGFGVNIVSHPEGMDYPTARLGDVMENPPAPVEFVGRLDETFAARLAQWTTSGFAPVRTDWLSRANGLGAEITVRAPHGPIAGVFRGIDAEGALLLETAEGVINVRAGAIAPPAAL